MADDPASTTAGPGGSRSTGQGWHEYTIQAWVDRFRTWHSELIKKHEAGRRTSPASYWKGPSWSAKRPSARRGPMRTGFVKRARAPGRAGEPGRHESRRALDPDLVERMARYPDRTGGLHVRPDAADHGRARAGPRYGAWYEMFPRSASPEPGRHGTLPRCRGAAAVRRRDGLRRPLPAADPPDRPGVPQGAEQHPDAPARTIPAAPGPSAGRGGHKAIHPELGTLEDFDRLVAAARELGIEIALDIAFQCSPDHPYVREHPGWFRHRPDGTIKYAENPPKKYQDIYPIDFECDDLEGLWDELRDVFLFWIGHGVRSSASTIRTPSRSRSGTG